MPALIWEIIQFFLSLWKNQFGSYLDWISSPLVDCQTLLDFQLFRFPSISGSKVTLASKVSVSIFLPSSWLGVIEKKTDCQIFIGTLRLLNSLYLPPGSEESPRAQAWGLVISLGLGLIIPADHFLDKPLFGPLNKSDEILRSSMPLLEKQPVLWISPTKWTS